MADGQQRVCKLSYLKTMYPEVKSSYPEKLCAHLSEIYQISDVRDLRFLEIGCGKGTHLLEFSKILDGEFCGVDFEKIPPIKGCSTFVCDLEKDRLPFKNETFNVIFSKSVIEHVYNTENFLKEAKRVLQPGGVLILMTPDWQAQMKNFYDDPTHVKPFTKQSMFASLQMHQFSNIEVKDFMQLPSTWKYPALTNLYSLIGCLIPERFKWKSSKGRNTNDRKFIRFAKENMILASCNKGENDENA